MASTMRAPTASYRRPVSRRTVTVKASIVPPSFGSAAMATVAAISVALSPNAPSPSTYPMAAILPKFNDPAKFTTPDSGREGVNIAAPNPNPDSADGGKDFSSKVNQASDYSLKNIDKAQSVIGGALEETARTVQNPARGAEATSQKEGMRTRAGDRGGTGRAGGSSARTPFFEGNDDDAERRRPSDFNPALDNQANAQSAALNAGPSRPNAQDNVFRSAHDASGGDEPAQTILSRDALNKALDSVGGPKDGPKIKGGY